MIFNSIKIGYMAAVLIWLQKRQRIAATVECFSTNSDTIVCLNQSFVFLQRSHFSFYHHFLWIKTDLQQPKATCQKDYDQQTNSNEFQHLIWIFSIIGFSILHSLNIHKRYFLIKTYRLSGFLTLKLKLNFFIHLLAFALIPLLLLLLFYA